MFVSTEATILHADLDAFYASVEQRDNPRLRGRPVIVGGGVVLACSYEAKALGVRTAMGGRQARRLCPHAIVVRPRMEAYTDASRAVFAVFEDTSPLVEGLSIDEAFLDVSGMRRIAGEPVEIAVRLRRTVLERVGLPITIGVARTKFLAKVASGVAKPDGLLVVPPDGELAFLHPLPVERLWGVGADHLREAPPPRDQHRRRGGAAAPRGRWCRCSGAGWAGSCTRSPTTATRGGCRSAAAGARWGRSARSGAGAGRARSSTPRSLTLVDRLTRRLRAARRVCRTVTLRLRFDDYSRATRSHTIPEATAQTETILAEARELLAAAMPMIERDGLTLIGIALGNLGDDRAVQLALPFETPPRPRPRHRARRGARPLRDDLDHARRAARPRPGPDDADAPRLTNLPRGYHPDQAEVQGRGA